MMNLEKCCNKIRNFISNKYIIILSIIVTLLGIVIVVWFVIRGIWFDEFINRNWNISLDKSAQFGDFIGGCVGTLFALTGVFLLYETLRLQRIELNDSKYIFKLQQFDSVFFNSLALYNAILESIKDMDGESKGRAFLDQKQKNILDDDQINTSGKSKNAYLNFYAKYEPQIAHYFRTIYQIFDQIYLSNIEKDDKVKYAKIIRAQFSQGELFFLYYNARSIYGEKFRKYINEYDLIKHLSIVDMPEYKKYFSNMSRLEKHTCKVAFTEIRASLKECVKESREWYKTYLKGRIAIKIKSDTDRSKLLVDFIYSTNAEPSNYEFQQGYGFKNLSKDDLKDLFCDFFNHVFKYSNFHLKNGSLLNIQNSESVMDGKTIIQYIIFRIDHKKVEI